MYPDTILAFHLKLRRSPDSKPEGPEAMMISSVCLRECWVKLARIRVVYERMVDSSRRWHCWGDRGRTCTEDVQGTKATGLGC